MGLDGIQLERQRAFFHTGTTLSVSFRREQLRRLQHELGRRRADMEAAMRADLGRHDFETFVAEELLLSSAIKTAIRQVKRWAAPKRVWPSVLNFPSRDTIIPEPYGVALIISPWNYPFLLSLAPLVAAISAGNCAVLKPSEYAPTAAALLASMIKTVFPPEYVTVVQGDAQVAGVLLAQRFDKIFFTGSARVGKIVLEAAARHLTPTTLELGGKSPCIVTKSADLVVAGRRIIWGKLLNAGQTCVAPDYILAHRLIHDALIGQLVEAVTTFYGRDIRHNPDYPRIVNAANFNRLLSYLDPQKVVWGGEHDAETRYFGPTIMNGITQADAIMQEEIFGPILPVITYDTMDEAIAWVNSYEKPLALYLFTGDKSAVHDVWSRCHFGGGCVNDTLSHLLNERLPFGGVGNSGMGSYHGKWGFDAFSHHKSLLHRALRPDLPVRYPPYFGKEWLKRLLAKIF
ncbi:MAG: aldehyde dehydrogenase [Desulfobulbus sp.]|jgi:aldehyde dehydrogenase (NAD+)